MKRLLRAVALEIASTLMRPFCGGLGFILVLHRVVPESGRSKLPSNRTLEITPEDLRALLTWLRRRGVEVIPLDDVPARLARPHGPRFCCFTLDDGYRDNLVHARPVFRDFRAPYAVNITNGYADGSESIWWYFLEEVLTAQPCLRFAWEGKGHEFSCATDLERNVALDALSGLVRGLGTARNALLGRIAEASGVDPLACTRRLAMTWAEVGELAAEPLATIGAHSACHHSLNRLSAEEIMAEVLTAKQDLEARIGREVRHFAYPFGGAKAVDEREFGIVRSAGFTTMLTTRPANLFPQNATRPDRLPRLGISGNYDAVKSLVMIESGLSSFIHERARKRRASGTESLG